MAIALTLFVGSGVAMLAMVSGKYIMNLRGIEKSRLGVTAKMDHVIGTKVHNARTLLMYVNSRTAKLLVQLFVRNTLFVILHAWHEIYTLGKKFLDRVRGNKVLKNKGSVSVFLKQVRDEYSETR